MPVPAFDHVAIADLEQRTLYEAWFLEAVYEIADDALAFKEYDGLIFPATGGPPPTETAHLSAHINLGDWRPGFLDAGAPLVFVSAFKLIDMFVEWVLDQNGVSPGWQFSKKLLAVKSTAVYFPSPVATRPWLRERLLALYERLEPLRSTVIHHRHFQSIGGALNISSSKAGTVGTPVPITPSTLRTLSLVLVSLLHCLRGTWPFDTFREKRLRHALDELAGLHLLPSLGQQAPVLKNVRVYKLDADQIEIDLLPIRTEAARRATQQDVVFRLRVVVVSTDGSYAEAFLIPFEELQGPSFRLSRRDRHNFHVPVPTGVDASEIARDLLGPWQDIRPGDLILLRDEKEVGFVIAVRLGAPDPANSLITVLVSGAIEHFTKDVLNDKPVVSRAPDQLVERLVEALKKLRPSEDAKAVEEAIGSAKCPSPSWERIAESLHRQVKLRTYY